MITMNDIISIKLTFLQAQFLCSQLSVNAFDTKESQPSVSKLLSKIEGLIQKQLDELDYSENEKLVDRINAKRAKEANE